MIISKKDLVFDYPSSKWKKVFKAGGTEEHNNQVWIKFICKFLDVEESEATKLFQQALNGNYFQETEPNQDGTRFYCCGLKGAAIANAHAGKRIKWEEAKTIYDEFLVRVKIVLEEDYYHYYVNNLVLFGSFLAGKDEVSDIDLTLTLIKKTWISSKETQQKIQELAASNKKSMSSMDYMFLPYHDVIDYLKSKERRLSLASEEIDQIIHQVDHKYFIKEGKYLGED